MGANTAPNSNIMRPKKSRSSKIDTGQQYAENNNIVYKHYNM